MVFVSNGEQTSRQGKDQCLEYSREEGFLSRLVSCSWVAAAHNYHTMKPKRMYLSKSMYQMYLMPLMALCCIKSCKKVHWWNIFMLLHEKWPVDTCRKDSLLEKWPVDTEDSLNSCRGHLAVGADQPTLLTQAQLYWNDGLSRWSLLLIFRGFLGNFGKLHYCISHYCDNYTSYRAITGV